jgi:predicted metallopeptidase
MKNKKTLGITLGIVALVIISIILLLIFKKPYVEPTFDHIEIPSTYSIINKTKWESLSKITAVGLQELELDTVYVTLWPLSEKEKQTALPGRELLAHILSGGNNQYIIFISEDNLYDRDYVKVLAHELIHLQQYQDGRITLDTRTGAVIYNGWPYDINSVEYDKRPWEIEAFEKSPQLQLKMIKRLYK